MSPTVAALFAAVYAAPEDDGPRAALAKWLRAQRDPRGELIELQLQRAAIGARPGKREKELLRERGKTWLAPLDVLAASTVEWERGFPVAGRVKFSRGDRTVPRAELATLRRLVLLDRRGVSVLDEKVERAIVMQPALRGIHELFELYPELLFSLPTAEPPFARLRVITCSDPLHEPRFSAEAPNVPLKQEPAAFRARFAAALDPGLGLPALRELSFGWAEYLTDLPAHHRWLFDTPVGRALEVFRLWQPHHSLDKLIAAWQRALPAHPTLRRMEFGKAVLARVDGRWIQIDS